MYTVKIKRNCAERIGLHNGSSAKKNKETREHNIDKSRKILGKKGESLHNNKKQMSENLQQKMPKDSK